MTIKEAAKMYGDSLRRTIERMPEKRKAKGTITEKSRGKGHRGASPYQRGGDMKLRAFQNRFLKGALGPRNPHRGAQFAERKRQVNVDCAAGSQSAHPGRSVLSQWQRESHRGGLTWAGSPDGVQNPTRDAPG